MTVMYSDTLASSSGFMFGHQTTGKGIISLLSFNCEEQVNTSDWETTKHQENQKK
jgi:hypothetical protein